jgi:hypothetical protein
MQHNGRECRRDDCWQHSRCVSGEIIRCKSARENAVAMTGIEQIYIRDQ